MSEASQEAPGEVFMQKTQQDKHSGLNPSYPNVSGHLATQLDIIKEYAWYFPQHRLFHSSDSPPSLFFFTFAWVCFFFNKTSIYIL